MPATPSQAARLILRDLETHWSWRGARISAHAPVRGVAFKLDPKTAENCTGQYQAPDGTVLIIRRQGGQFSAQTGGDDSADLEVEELIPGSETIFFSPTRSMALTFQRDNSGKVTSLLRHVYEDHTRFAKVGSAPAGIAQADADRFLGVWEGTFVLSEQTRLHTAITISKTNSSYQAAFDITDKGLTNIPFTTVVFVGNSALVLTCPSDSGQAMVRATLNATATELSGTWKEGQGSLSLSLRRAARPKPGADKIE